MAGTYRTEVGLPPKGVGLPDLNGTGYATTSRQPLFGNLYLCSTDLTSQLLVGGLQTMSFEDSAPTELQPQAGSDWNEPIIKQRKQQGSGGRFMVRGHSLPEIMFAVSGKRVGDIDWRMLPFIWQYTFTMQTATGDTTIESASWQYSLVWITRYKWAISDPFQAIAEDFDWVGRTMSFNNVTTGGGFGSNAALAF